jgi:2-polyprenyl-3-methyl-5-hydroxy-6-metoxy-1,4-benzoquinol methylase
LLFSTPTLRATCINLKNLTNCPVCESERFSLAFSAPTTRGLDERQWLVSECGACGHQFMNPQPSQRELEFYYNSEYDAYDPMHGSEDSDDREVEQAKLTGKIRHIPLPAGLRLLDVGCGAGWFLRICKKLGAIEQGVEPSAYGSEIAQKQGLRVFHGTLEEYVEQAPTGTQFDIITANHVVEHLHDPVKTLHTMKGLLAPRGYLWIAVPNAAYPICRALKGRWHSSDLPYHLMHFTPESMAEAGSRAGLKVLRQATESMVPQVAASIGLFLRYRCFLPRRLTQHFGAPLDFASQWYARRVDAKVNGEAVLTEFVAD